MKNITPLIRGTEKFDYWCRSTEKGLTFFLANPRSKHLTFPLEYGQSLNQQKVSFPVEINYAGKKPELLLTFNPYQSLLLNINQKGEVKYTDITFVPKTPIYKPRIRKGKDPWEV